ncbi:MAG: thioredoxin family protein [Planctomycetes bacterium]|nr:thioredoxin family protein [Planctomycetota bacterium]
MTRTRSVPLSLLLLALAAAAFPASAHAEDASPAAAPGIVWKNDLAAAGAEAKAQGKLVVIQFVSAGSAACSKLDADTFANADVVKFFGEKVVPVRFDLKEKKEMAEKLEVLWSPTLIVMLFEADGKVTVLRMITGYRAAADLLAELQQGVDGHKRIAELTKAAPTDVDGQAELGELCRNEGKVKEAKAAFQAIVQADPKNAKGKTTTALFGLSWIAIVEDDQKACKDWVVKLDALDKQKAADLRGRLALASANREMNPKKNFKGAAIVYGQIAKQFAKTELAPEALYFEGVSRALGGDDAGFKDAWGRLVSTYPDSDWAKRSCHKKE